MKRKLLLTASVLALSCASAMAADLGRGGLKDGPGYDAGGSDNTVKSWTGFYIGGRVGYGNANHDLSVQDYFKNYCADKGDETVGFDEDGNLDHNAWKTVENKKKYWPSITGDTCETLEKSEGPGRTFEAGSHVTVPGDSREVASLDGLNSHGFVGGVQLGADYQLNRFVVGVFGSYDLSGMETDGNIGDFASFKIEKGDEWSLGARVGYLATPRTMVYALAAYTQTDYDFSAQIGGEGGKKTVDFDGISVGGGIEIALTSNVFLGAEYQHTFYGKETILDVYDADINRGGRLVDEIDEDKVMATLKFKLNSLD